MTQKSLSGMESATTAEKADAKVAEAFLPHASHVAVEAIGEISDLSDQEPLYAGSAAVIAVGLVMRDVPTVRAGTRILASHLLATAMRGIVKRLVDRTRPDVAASKGSYELRSGQRYESDFNSFPSGHSAGAFAVARAASRDYPGATGPALGLAGAAAVAQVVRSKHFTTDVIAGAAIGLVAEAAVDKLLQRAARI